MIYACVCVRARSMGSGVTAYSTSCSTFFALNKPQRRQRHVLSYLFKLQSIAGPSGRLFFFPFKGLLVHQHEFVKPLSGPQRRGVQTVTSKQKRISIQCAEVTQEKDIFSHLSELSL